MSFPPVHDESCQTNWDLLSQLLPPGIIMLTSQATAPRGWGFCNGTEGKPNHADTPGGFHYIIKLP